MGRAPLVVLRFADLSIERSSAYPEELGRARFAIFGNSESAFDVPAFEPRHIGGQPNDVRLVGRCDVGHVANALGKIAQLDSRAVATNERVFDGASELAHVAGPSVVLNSFERVARKSGHLDPPAR